MNINNKLILGAGITGLSAGVSTRGEIYEATGIPGGICRSYYVTPSGKKTYFRENNDSYRFEIGGGHWIFGADNEVLDFIKSFVSVKSYERNSAVYFPDMNIYVPFPIQNYLFYLPKDIRLKALKEIKSNLNKQNFKAATTMKEWLKESFGRTLSEVFFFPFHELYTAGLYTEIAPQDKFKTPLDLNLIIKGAESKTPAVGYNAIFIYPKEGLDRLLDKMAKRCKINYNKKVAKIDLNKKEVLFKDGSGVKYESLISTLSLNKIIKMTNIKLEEQPDPYTSVLVVNIGAKKGSACPDYHWLYIPKSKSGFYRIGFYSNVDNSFLPLFSQKHRDRVSIYVEKAYRRGKKPQDKEIKKICSNIVKELKDWKFIKEAEVVDPTWIEVAYTWQYPNSSWKDKAIDILKRNSIYSIGRYGKWKFQGIAESIKDGFLKFI